MFVEFEQIEMFARLEEIGHFDTIVVDNAAVVQSDARQAKVGDFDQPMLTMKLLTATMINGSLRILQRLK